MKSLKTYEKIQLFTEKLYVSKVLKAFNEKLYVF